MRMSRFDECLKFVLGREGGTSNDPNDAGKLTSRGITQATCAKAHARGLVGTGDPTKLTNEEVRAIYREFYWRAAGCGHLPEPLDLVVFDEAVNCGVGQAVRDLQDAMNRLLASKIAVDGGFGPQTLAALELLMQFQAEVSRVSPTPYVPPPPVAPGFLVNALVDGVLGNRVALYDAITDGVAATAEKRAQEVKNRTFLRGWIRRTVALGDAAGT